MEKFGMSLFGIAQYFLRNADEFFTLKTLPPFKAVIHQI
jgi:hypothetical protein